MSFLGLTLGNLYIEEAMRLRLFGKCAVNEEGLYPSWLGYLLPLRYEEVEYEFTQYMSKELRKYFKEGYLSIYMDKGTPYVQVLYETIEAIDSLPGLIEPLIEYTQGQLADGIGECIDQEAIISPCGAESIHISLWYPEQVLEYEIEEGGF